MNVAIVVVAFVFIVVAVGTKKNSSNKKEKS